MKKLIAITTLILLAASTLISQVGCGKETEVLSGPPQRSGGLGMNPSWAFTYHSVSDMCAHSDVIAVGVAERIIESRGEGAMLYMTYWDFRVEKTLKGEETEKLTVVQTGSPDVPGSDIRADPLFLPGDRYLLFLRESSAGNLWFHPQGRYLIWGNKVYSMNYILLDGAALSPPSGLDCNGVDLDNVIGRITEIVDSAQLIFTQYKARVPGDIMRYPAGITLDAYANLSTGKNGPGKITYKINQEALPEGLEVSIRPAEFTADPYTEYESTLIIMVAPDLTPGTYQILVEYNFEGVGSGKRTITLHVQSPE